MGFADAYHRKRVFVTGHTGFKGAWLTEWLLLLGAEITGYSLPPPTQPALFEQLDLARRITHLDGDVRDLPALRRSVEQARPDFIFHLAAQPLVRLSYREPVETYSTNLMGTVNLLEAVRLAGRPCVIVMVTTDKCYENKEWLHAYREEDPMGGHDPYSSSKGAAELVINAYRRSYFSSADLQIFVASARAGNVVGGGDWSADRIVPDCIRCLQKREDIPVRNKQSTRPWQHVLEPLSGYLALGSAIATAPTVAARAVLASPFNFGPGRESNRPVVELVREILKHWPGNWQDRSELGAVHEATLLNLSTDKAHHLLQWAPVWTFEETIARTVQWYRESESRPTGMADFTVGQINAYQIGARTQPING